MNKRLILAVALSMIVLFFFQRMGTRTEPPSMERRETITTERQDTPPPVERRETIEELYDADKEVFTHVQNEKFEMVFSNKGASLKSVVLKKSDTNPERTLLFEINDPERRPLALDSDLLPFLEKRVFDLERTADQLIYTYEEPGTARVVKTIRFPRRNDHLNVQIEIENLSGSQRRAGFSMIGPSSLERAPETFGRDFLQAEFMIDGDLWREKRVKSERKRTGNVAWASLKNRYYAVILRPLDRTESARIRPAEQDNFTLDVGTGREVLSPGASYQSEFMLYMGPLNIEMLAAYGADMERVVDYGIFGAFSRILLRMLRTFHGWVGSWGWAIIMLTLLINLLLFPLTVKSFTSMHRMKQIQPHIEKLKQMHKDDPQKVNKEMMELYKKYNVNPLGGCLPMLLQMPIFIGLYQGLMRAIELKAAEFMWIKDLGAPDAVPLPFSLPFFGNSLNVLPLLMVGVMVVQQKISQPAGASSAAGSNPQKNMMIIMPIVFGFIFYRMPSGLVLYWLVNTILMTFEQALISRKLSTE